VREALRARRRALHRLYVGADAAASDVADLLELAAAAGVPVERVPREVIRQLPGGAAERSQGALLDAGPLPTVALDALCRAGPAGSRLLVALDGVEDPQNLGAIARVVDAAGASGLVVPERRSAPLSPAVSRASAGAIEWVPVARIGNLPRALSVLKEAGYWTIGTEVEAASELFSLPARAVEGDLVVVLGAEGRGIRPGVERHLDHRIRIPMAGRIASLNVSTAAAVVLFELGRRRRSPG
jgi:23S rRNA (guanosine2251-2'-O)-methyltransferase